MKRYTKQIILAVLAVLIIGVGTLTVYEANKSPVAPQQAQAVTPAPVQPPTVDELLTLVNKERAKVGVPALTIDSRLNQSAQFKADDMQKYNYFGHISPNDGRHGYEYINDVGIRCRTDSENLTDNVTNADNTSQQAVYSWMHSTEHREALEDSKYTVTGFGISGTKVVEHFCQQ